MRSTGPMIMTASTNKKIRKKRRRRNEMLVFVSVLLLVLLAGSVGLAFLAVKKEQRLENVRQEDTKAIKKSAQEAGKESIFGKIAEDSLLTRGLDTEVEDPWQQKDEPAGKYDALLQDAEAMEQNNIYAKEAASPEEVVLTFAGDVLFDPQYAVMATLLQQGGRIEEAFSADLLKLMQSADIFMVNNEFPYTDRGEPLPEKMFTFRAEPERAAYLKDMGVDVVSLANNHAYDFGEISLLDSLDTLRSVDMPYVGAGKNLEEASRPVSFIINDKKIAIIAATQIERNDHPDTKGAGENSPGTFRCWNVERLLKAVEDAKADNDYVIVYIHWGTENQAETDWAQDEQAVKIAEAGADAIIGAHPHCLQPVGYVQEVPVIYSLGNFWFNSKTLDTALVQLIITKEDEIRIKLIPAKQQGCKTQLLYDLEKKRVIDYINSISTTGYLDEEGYLMEGSNL